MEAFYNMGTPAAFVLCAIVVGVTVACVARWTVKSSERETMRKMDLDHKRLMTIETRKPPQIDVD